MVKGVGFLRLPGSALDELNDRGLIAGRRAVLVWDVLL